VHFLYAVPRLIFLTAPLVYMLLGQRNIAGLWLAIAAYAVPHLVLSTLTNSRLQGKYRYSYWNEIYEAVLAPYILGPTLLALINPRLGKFNVTVKGGIVPQSYFDRVIARPYRYLLLLNYIGLAVAPWRFFVHNADHKGAVLMNVCWILFNCIILGTANAVAVEAQQLRTNIRLERKLQIMIRIPSGILVSGMLNDFSLGGGSMTLDRSVELQEFASIEVIYPMDEQEVVLPAHIIGRKGLQIRFQYESLSLAQQELLTRVLYSRADSWISSEPHPSDRPLQSLWMIFRLSLRGIRYSIPGLTSKTVTKGAEVALMALFCWTLFSSAAHGLDIKPKTTTIPESALHQTVSIANMGNPDGILLHGAESYAQTDLVFSDMDIAQNGVLHLQYSFSPGMSSGRSLLTVVFNGTTLTELSMPPPTPGREVLSIDLPLPADLLSTRNVLQFQLHGHYEARCEDPTDPRLWARILPTSQVEISGSLIPIASDLSQLPRPFYEQGVTVSQTAIGVSFDESPSTTMLRAAAALSSWLGVQANSHALIFPVSIGHLHPGNGIVFIHHDSTLITPRNLPSSGPTLSIETNPLDGISKLLVVSGDTDDQILSAAQALAVGKTFSGESASVGAFTLPPLRQLDDAPRWVQTNEPSSLWSYTETSDLQSDGSQPIVSYVRIPPDLFYGDHETVPMRVNYQYKRSPETEGAFLRITVNGSQIAYLPLPVRVEGSPQSTIVPVPIANLRPFANTLLFDFVFPIVNRNVCRTLPTGSSTGTLFRSSSLDLREFPHWTALPNLELFANAGFPFTRQAALSQTSIILPQHPTEQEIEAMLEMLAYFGAQTGSPALRVEIGGIEDFDHNRDLLVIGNEADMVTVPKLDAMLPMGFDQGGPVRQLTTTLSLARRIWTRLSRMDPDSFSDLRGIEEESRLDRALQQDFNSVIQAVESPNYPQRSAIVILLGSEKLGLFPSFLQVASSAQIHGNVVIQHGSAFESFSINQLNYYVGHITVVGRIRAWMHQHPWAGVLLPFLMGLLWAPWVQARLKMRATRRLRGDIAI
jgi:cellulose synthase (UDP-forming)